nr:DnaJ protein homolog [Tanacetum cinerariifolium]
SISAILSGVIDIHYGHVLIHFKGHAEMLKQWVTMALGLLDRTIVLYFSDDQFKAINDEGMTMYQRPFVRDNGVVDIGPPADWVTINVQRNKDYFEVYALVPGLLRKEMTDMKLDECKETTLYDVNIEEEMRRK